MLINILLILFILSVTGFQMAQGLYSSVINMMLAFFAAVVAFNFYEPLGAALDHGTAYGEAIALVLLFALSYSALRITADLLFRHDIAFPKWVDKPAAAATGFVTALIGAGIMLLALQMLPLPSDLDEARQPERLIVSAAPVMDYNRFPLDPTRPMFEPPNREPAALAGGEQQFWLQPDRFAIGLFCLISDTGLRGATSFRQVHPDLPAELYARRCTPQYRGVGKERGFSRRLLPPEAFQVLDCQFVPDPWADVPDPAGAERKRLLGPTRFLRLLVRLTKAACDEDETVRFSGLQWRLRAATNLGTRDQPQYNYRDRYPCAWSGLVSGGSAFLHLRSPRDFYPALDGKEWDPQQFPRRLVETQTPAATGSSSAAEGLLVLLFELQDKPDEQPVAIEFKGGGLRPLPPPAAATTGTPAP